MPTDNPRIRRAFARLRAAIDAGDPGDAMFDETLLSAYAEQRLSEEQANVISGLLADSPALLQFFVDLRTPPAEETVNRAVDLALAGGAEMPADPRPGSSTGTFDPFAPTPPTLRLEGPFGGLQQAMDAPANSTRFGPDSLFSMVGHGMPSIPFVVTPEGEMRVVDAQQVTVKGNARRVSAPASALFGRTGTWTVGFVAGVPADALGGGQLAALRTRYPDARWQTVEIHVVDA